MNKHMCIKCCVIRCRKVSALIEANSSGPRRYKRVIMIDSIEYARNIEDKKGRKYQTKYITTSSSVWLFV